MAIIDKSTLKKQHYGQKLEIRKPIAKTSIVTIKIETLDISTGLGSIVGYSYIPLFMQTKNKGMPAETEEHNVHLMTGNY